MHNGVWTQNRNVWICSSVCPIEGNNLARAVCMRFLLLDKTYIQLWELPKTNLENNVNGSPTAQFPNVCTQLMVSWTKINADLHLDIDNVLNMIWTWNDVPVVLCLCTGLLQVTIRGQLFPHEGGTGKNVFLMPADQEGEHSNATIMCSVEELSLAHYCRQGFDQGRHGCSPSIPPSWPSNCK